MNSQQLQQSYSFADFLEQIQQLVPILTAINNAGGRPYLVGGCVRDLVMKHEIKDIDIEVHGLSVDQLEEVLATFGSVLKVGKQFGVLRIANLDIDWSLPRTDSLGRKPKVHLDPQLSIEKALRRRDLTINAMALDLMQLINTRSPDYQQLCDLIIDPYNGKKALKNEQLQEVDASLFVQDPLRFFRVLQFMARFEFQVSESLTQLCKSMSLHDEVTGKPIAPERIFEELQKLFLKSKCPSIAFRWLVTINRLEEIFPELYATIGVPQRPDYHPEGDVFEHTMQALDAAAGLDELIAIGREKMGKSKQGDDEQTRRLSDLSFAKEKFILMLTALLHDVGKPLVTKVESPTVIRSWDHEIAGVPVAQSFIKRITNDIYIYKVVSSLIRYHMNPSQMVANKVSAPQYKKLAAKLAPRLSLWYLSLIYHCDLRGRNGSAQRPLKWPPEVDAPFFIKDYRSFVKRAMQAGVLYEAEPALVQGRDLLEYYEPGPELGAALERMYQIQLEQGVTDKHTLIDLVRKGALS